MTERSPPKEKDCHHDCIVERGLSPFGLLRPPPFPRKGEMVVIDQDMLSRHLATLQGPIYYSAGPPAMVASMRATLVSAGVDEDDIRTDDFAGY